MNVIPLSFYARDTHTVARELLGKILVRQWRGVLLTGRITEVESYVGENDKACHASRGRTPRTRVMYGEAGRAYVYLVYGMYFCFNIVTEQKDFPAAVLVRALEPLDGLPVMQRVRNTDKLTNITTGPGKLTQALHITRAQNNQLLTLENGLYVADDGNKVPSSSVVTSPRIGVSYAGSSALLPWRYYLRDSVFVS